MVNAHEEPHFTGDYDEDGDEIVEYFWQVNGTKDRVPDPPHVRVARHVSQGQMIKGTFEDTSNTREHYAKFNETFDSVFLAYKVLGILVTAVHSYDGQKAYGKFVADKVIPCAT
jgi:hypothetical protein